LADAGFALVIKHHQIRYRREKNRHS
jgi:hypothetical protein